MKFIDFLIYIYVFFFVFFYNMVALEESTDLICFQKKKDLTKISEKKKDQIKCRIYIVCFSTTQLLIKYFERIRSEQQLLSSSLTHFPTWRVKSPHTSPAILTVPPSKLKIPKEKLHWRPFYEIILKFICYITLLFSTTGEKGPLQREPFNVAQSHIKLEVS